MSRLCGLHLSIYLSLTGFVFPLTDDQFNIHTIISLLQRQTQTTRAGQRPIPPSPSHATDASISSRPSFAYHPGMQYYGNTSYGHHFNCDESSVHSALSGDSYPLHVGEGSQHGVVPNAGVGVGAQHRGMPPAPPPHPHQQFYPQMLQPPTPDHSMNISENSWFDPYQMHAAGMYQQQQQPWFGQPPMYPMPPMDPNANAAAAAAAAAMNGGPDMPPSPAHGIPVNNGAMLAPPPGFDGTTKQQPQEQHGPAQNLDESGMDLTAMTHQTPYKQEPQQHGVPMSPYWGHLDYATLAMTGLMTPNTSGMVAATPTKSKKKPVLSETEEDEEKNSTEDANETTEADSSMMFNPAQPYFCGSVSVWRVLCHCSIGWWFGCNSCLAVLCLHVFVSVSVSCQSLFLTFWTLVFRNFLPSFPPIMA